jgi:hypothetical protein
VIKPRELIFGETYEDKSGYQWSVRLVHAPKDNGPSVIIEGPGGDVQFDALSVTIRNIAKALDAIADLLGESK